jgi:ABC-2 type transport system permease protein
MGQMYNYQSFSTFDLERMFLFWIFSSLYIGCFTSLFIFVSTLSKSSKMAFTMSALLLGITIYFSVQGRTEYLKYITPYHYGFAVSEIMKNTYEISEYSTVVQNLLSMLLFIVATLSIDVFTFKRREL